MSSLKASSGVRKLVPWHVNDARPLYSHITTVPSSSRVITFAGQIGRRLDGSVSSDPAEQVAEAYRNLKNCLDAAGATVNDILKLTYYIVNYDPERRWFRGPTQEFLNGHLPATTLVPVPALALPGLAFEVEAVAAIPEAPLRKVDVVVVGAGLSGLQAAVNVQEAGYDCVVVEARDRVGGKTLSRDIACGKQDVGAAWINDTNQSKMWELVKKFGLETVEQNTNGECVFQDPADGKFSTFPYGGIPQRSAESGGVENMVQVRDLFESLCHKIDISDPVASCKEMGKDYDKMSMADFVKSEGGGNFAMATINVWCKAMLGLEAREVGCLFFLDYCKSGGGIMLMRSDKKDGGQYLRLVEGESDSLICSLPADQPRRDADLLSQPCFGLEATNLDL